MTINHFDTSARDDDIFFIVCNCNKPQIVRRNMTLASSTHNYIQMRGQKSGALNVVGSEACLTPPRPHFAWVDLMYCKQLEIGVNLKSR